MTQEIFVIKGILSLRGLPGWLAKRQYNTVRHGMYDRNDNDLVGLTSNIGNMMTKTGLICVRDETLVPSVVKICQECCPQKVRILEADTGPKEFDLRVDFLSLLAENESLMPEHAAMAVTCTQLGITEDEGYDLCHEATEAVVVRKAA